MNFSHTKQTVPPGTNPKPLHRTQTQLSFSNRYSTSNLGCENNFANYYQPENANPGRDDPLYNNFNPRNEYWDSHQNQNFYRSSDFSDQPDQSQNYYHNEKEAMYQPGQQHIAEEIFYDSSSVNGSRNYNQSGYEEQIKNSRDGLNSTGFSYPTQEQNKPILKSQNQGSKREQAKTTTKQLLQKFNITAQANKFDLISKVGSLRNRGSLLYQNLNSLMAGKKTKEGPSLQSEAKLIKTEAKVQEIEQKPVEEPRILPEISRISEAPKPFAANGVKGNSLYYSLAKVEKNISTRIKIEQLAANGDRKRSKRFWNAERDAQLITLIKAHGQDWVAISDAFNDPEMTPKVIQERYENRISPQINKARFSLQEDQLIAHYYTTLGANWKKITSHLPGRTETMVRNRFYSSIKKKLLEDGFNQKSSEIMPDVSTHSSGNKLANYPSAGDHSSKDDLSEKYTGKFCEPEIKSGSTAASVSLKKKLLAARKLGKHATNKKDRLPNLLQTQPSNASRDQWEQLKFEGNMHSSENFKPEQYSDEMNYKNQQSNAIVIPSQKQDAKFENFNDFNLEFHSELPNTQNKRPISPIGNPFSASPVFGTMRKNVEQEPWDPLGFGNEFEMNRRETHDIIGFDKISLLNEKLDFHDDTFHNPSFNPLPQENFCEDFLNLKDNGHNCVSREHPLTSMEENALPSSQKNKKPTTFMEEELQNSLAASNRNQAALPTLQNVFSLQGQTAEPNIAPLSKLNQLESLMSQIRSIERLFDRTKQEINILQGRFTAK